MYSQNEKAIIWLSNFESLTYVKTAKLLSLYSNAKDILNNLETDKQIITKIVGYKIYNQMISYDLSKLENYINSLNNAGIKCITIESELYPESLKNINQPPILLFAKGDLSLLNKTGIAVVGTRNPTSYGKNVTEEYAKFFAENNIVVISGLATGVDKISHETALRVNGKTIAVLAGGFNKIYPPTNTNLAKEIVEKGLVITEYPPDVIPTKYSFPFRNRIIAGLSEAVVLTETALKSGSFHTKNFAIEQGKNVYAIPCNINNARTEGNNQLIKFSQALITTNPEDVFKSLGLALKKTQKEEKIISSEPEQIILKVLSDGEKNIEELQFETKLELKSLNSCLTMLQIRGLIKKLPGNQFSL